MSIFQRTTPVGVRGRHITYRPELDGIRGLAIIMIVFHHFDYVGYNYFGGRGFLGVDIFFALSGYLITQILIASRKKKENIGFFYLRRVARLYPILVISVVGISIYYRNNYQFLDRSPAINSILYIKNFKPWGGVFGPLWSLAAEEQFYLIFPAILFFGLKFLRKRGLSALLILYVAAIWTHALIINSPQFNFNQDGVFNLVIFRPSILLVGCLIAIHKDWLEKLVSRRVYLTLALFVICVWGTIRFQFPPLAGIATGLLILLISETVVRKSLITRLMRALIGARPIAWIGLLSYSIYFWHLPLIFINTHHFMIKAITNMPLFFLQLLIIAGISFYLIERPAMRVITSLANKIFSKK